MKSIAIGCDHAGYDKKELLKRHLLANGYTVDDFGTFTPDSVDYPDYAHKVAEAVESGKHPIGLLLCGSANGVCMSANKHQGIRAALAWQPEIASLARQHNDANIVCIPARFTSDAEAIAILDAFLAASFEGGRHGRRVDKIRCV
jgi:ribose 5-phosphate isomerase B